MSQEESWNNTHPSSHKRKLVLEVGSLRNLHFQEIGLRSGDNVIIWCEIFVGNASKVETSTQVFSVPGNSISTSTKETHLEVRWNQKYTMYIDPEDSYLRVDLVYIKLKNANNISDSLQEDESENILKGTGLSPVTFGRAAVPFDELGQSGVFDDWLEFFNVRAGRSGASSSENSLKSANLLPEPTPTHHRRTSADMRNALSVLNLNEDMIGGEISLRVQLISPLATRHAPAAEPEKTSSPRGEKKTEPSPDPELETTSHPVPKQMLDSMIDVLSKYKVKSEGFLAQDVSVTIIDCFKGLLQQHALQDQLQKDIDTFLDKYKESAVMKSDLCTMFKQQKFTPVLDDKICQKIIQDSVPGNVEMREVAQDLLVFILGCWGMSEKSSRRFAMVAFTKRYEDGILKTAGLTGFAKKLFPLFTKVVLATGITVYACMRDTYTQFIDNYFKNKIMFFSKLPNPDYYGRLGAACHDTLMMKMTKIKSQDQYIFLQYIVKALFSPDGPPPTEHKLCQSFSRLFRKTEQPYNAEKYISGYNYVAPEPKFQPPPMTRTKSATLKSVLVHQLEDQNKPLPASETNTAAIRVVESVEKVFKASSLAPSMENTEANTKRTNLYIVETSPHCCASLYEYFHNDTHGAKIVQSISFTYLIHDQISYDCLLLKGNAFGYDEIDKLNSDIRGLFGVEIFERIRNHINTFYFGEMPLGSCFLLPTNHAKVKYIAYCANRYLDKPAVSVYQCMWSSMSAVLQHNQAIAKKLAESREENAGKPVDSPIKSILSAEFSQALYLGNKESARQMYLAWRRYLQAAFSVPMPSVDQQESSQPNLLETESSTSSFGSGKTSLSKGRSASLNLKKDKDTPRAKAPASGVFSLSSQTQTNDAFQEATQRQQELITNAKPVKHLNPSSGMSEDVLETEEATFRKLLLEGYLTTKRGFICLAEVKLLLKWLLLEDESERIKLNAASVLTYYAFPEELYQGIRDIILSQGALDTLLTLAVTGKVQVHQEIPKANVTVGEWVAEGASGRVHKGQYESRLVAVKVCGENFLGFDMTEFTREVAIMSIVRHKNVLHCFGANTSDRNELLIVTEWIPNGSLRNLITNQSVEMTWPMRLSLAIQIAKGMEFLHSLHIIHCDLKSDNIMLAENLAVKIIDFGASRTATDDTTTVLGTTQWLAPEVFSNNGHATSAADVYAFGVILWELLTRELPWEGTVTYAIPDLVLAGKRPRIPKQFANTKYANLITACWQGHASKRPTFSQIIQDLNRLGEEHHLYL